MSNLAAANVIAVFTGETLQQILDMGGSQSWVLNRNNAKRCEYIVCCRSGVNWAEGAEPRGSAFLVGRISNVVATPAPEYKGRWLVQFSEFAKISVPNAWQQWRNPVRYTDFRSLGIDPTKLDFKPMPEPNAANVMAPSPTTGQPVAPLTIGEAKKGLAKSFGVSEDAIEITIRG